MTRTTAVTPHPETGIPRIPAGDDRVVITNGDTVTSTSNVDFNEADSANGLNLNGGSTLIVNGSVTSVSNGGSGSTIVNNIGTSTTIGTLTITGILSAGNSGVSSGSSSNFNIFAGSSLSAGSFVGVHGSGTNASAGGWTLGITGGDFTVGGAFD